MQGILGIFRVILSDSSFSPIAVFKVKMQDQLESLLFLTQHLNGWTKAPKLSLQQETEAYTPSEFPKATFCNRYVP